MSTNDTLVITLVTAIHVAALIVMIWIRVRRTPGDGLPRGSVKIEPCAVCGQPSTDWAYDGLDPDEQHDPASGRTWSADMTHYQPVCPAHQPSKSALTA
jgi:hypothetical protein